MADFIYDNIPYEAKAKKDDRGSYVVFFRNTRSGQVRIYGNFVGSSTEHAMASAWSEYKAELEEASGASKPLAGGSNNC